MTEERGALTADFQFDCSFDEYRAAIKECVDASPTLDMKAQNSFVVKAFELVMWWWNLRRPVRYRFYENGYEKAVRNKPTYSSWSTAIGWSETEHRIWILHRGGRSGFAKSSLDNESLDKICNLFERVLGQPCPLPSLVDHKSRD
jgi:hypothetical protein